MASRKTPKLTLKEASDHAYEVGLLNTYFHGLDDYEKQSLQHLLRRTAWRQSTSSRQKGHSTLYAFHESLRRQHPIRKAEQPYGSPLRRKAETAEIHAMALYEALGGVALMPEDFDRAIDAFSVAADSWDDIGERREALRMKKYITKLEERRAKIAKPERDRRRSMRRHRTAKRARDARSPRVSATKRAWIQKKIRILRHEGYPPLQAVAIAHRMAGVPRPNRPTKHLTPSERRQSLRARRRRARARAR